MTIYSLDILLSLFGINVLFHVQFYCFLTSIQISQEAEKVVWYSHLFVKEKLRALKIAGCQFLCKECFYYPSAALEVVVS